MNSDYTGLREKLPEGLELATDADVVLILGPNGSGKTALLRMLATSVEFQRYFLKHQISHFIDYSVDGAWAVGKVIEEVRESVRIDLKDSEEIGTWYYCRIDPREQRVFEKFCGRRQISLDDSGFNLISNRGLLYPGIFTSGFIVISEEIRDRIINIDLWSDTDENVFGFVKPTVAGKGELYFQHFDLPYDGVATRIQSSRVRRYLAFENTDVSPHTRYGKSPGVKLYEQLVVFLERDVAQFFEDHKVSEWEERDFSLQGRTDEMFGMRTDEERRADSLVDVPNDVRLCVVMDEPTLFLDVVNGARFQVKMREMVARYKGRLQFMITTNDRALIDGFRGNCVCINMYEPQAVSSREFDVQKYLS